MWPSGVLRLPALESSLGFVQRVFSLEGAPLLNLVGNLASTPFFQASPRSEQEGQEENTVTPKAPVGVS